MASDVLQMCECRCVSVCVRVRGDVTARLSTGQVLMLEASSSLAIPIYLLSQYRICKHCNKIL